MVGSGLLLGGLVLVVLGWFRGSWGGSGLVGWFWVCSRWVGSGGFWVGPVVVVVSGWFRVGFGLVLGRVVPGGAVSVLVLWWFWVGSGLFLGG